MNSDVEVNELRRGLFVWQRYDLAVKADLFSTGVTTAAGLYVIDPICPRDEGLAALVSNSNVVGVIVTNSNHARAAAAFAEKAGVAIYVHQDAAAAVDSIRVVAIVPGRETPSGLTTIGIEGAPAGEIAVHCASDGGTLIIGDALINFGTNGFTFLPAKYCSNARLMRKSLPKLLDYEFERILFAHGTPITSQARARLAALLEAGPASPYE